MENILFYEFIIEWYIHVIIVILHGANCEMSFQFRSKANFQNFVKAIKSMNLQTHEPVNFKKTTKIEPNENKVFHSRQFTIFYENFGPATVV